MHDSNLTCICLILWLGLDWIFFQNNKQNMSSVSLKLLTNSTSEAQNPRRDTNLITIIAGLSSDRLYSFRSESTTFFCSLELLFWADFSLAR